MAKNKLILIFPFLIIVLMAWMNINDSNKRDEEKLAKQQELIEEADAYIQDGIFFRAEESLKAAKKLNVGDLDAIDQKLLIVYKGEEDTGKWANAIESRIKKETATDEEINELLTFYTDYEKYEKALNAALSCLEHYPDNTAAMEIKEKVMYDYLYEEYKYSDIGTTGKYTAYCDDDGLWYIHNAKGTKNDEGYEYAWTYSPNAEYAAISENGKIYIIDSEHKKYALCHDENMSVAFVDDSSAVLTKDGKYFISDYELEEYSEAYDYAGCEYEGVRACCRSGSWFFEGAKTDAQYEEIAVNEMGQAFVGGRAFVKTNGSYQLIDKEGNSIGADTYADACAFIEKDAPAAVMNSEGKWGFADSEGNLVIPYQFEEARSFSSTVAAVKNSDGKWGYIDISGRQVIPYQYIEARSFIEDKAFAKGDAGWGIVEFRYYKYF